MTPGADLAAASNGDGSTISGLGKDFRISRRTITAGGDFDRTTGRWMEFEHLGPGNKVSIAEPQRYVDAAGHILIRFVNRQAPNSGAAYFTLVSQLEGSLP